MNEKIFSFSGVTLFTGVSFFITALFVSTASIATNMPEIMDEVLLSEKLSLAVHACTNWYVYISPLMFALLLLGAMSVGYTVVVLQFVINLRKKNNTKSCTNLTMKSIAATVVGLVVTLGGNYTFGVVSGYIPNWFADILPFGGIEMVILGVMLLVMNAYSAYLQTKHPFVCEVQMRDGDFLKPFS